MRRTIILDCDPGVDDALAITFAAGHPDVHLRGITTVAGNVDLDLTTDNALRVSEFVGAAGTPVTAGSPVPLLRPPLRARAVHGERGLGGATLPAPTRSTTGGHAVDYLVDTVAAAPGEMTLVATGPLTNIALALRREPRLVTMVRDFVVMGGSAGRGNVTPAAEFNIAADPEAAAVVFGAGWTVMMVGLDVTLRARATAEVRQRMRGLGRLADTLVLPALARYASDADPFPALADGAENAPPTWRPAQAPAGTTGSYDGAGRPGPSAPAPPVHDICAVALVARPELLRCVPARVEVETTGRWTSGMTVADFRAPVTDCNARVALAIDVPAFWDEVLIAYTRVAAALGGSPQR